MENDESKIMVSIICTTYNHDKYVKDALEGFVNQLANFKYEVIIHDDCSSDNTKAIIEEYKKKYPDIIKPIYQEENQLSKGISIYETYIFPNTKGKYLAFCEGDDYWCDKYKLKKQVDFLEKHNEYVACVHNSYILNCKENTMDKISKVEEDCDINSREIILWKKGHYQTSSLMFRAEYFKVPNEIKCKGIGDYPRALYLISNGKIRYLSDVMSVYRYLSNTESWSSSINSNNKKQIEHYKKTIDMLERFDIYTNTKFHDDVRKAIDERSFIILGIEKKFNEQIKLYPAIVKKLEPKEKLKLYIKASYIYKLLKREK